MQERKKKEPFSGRPLIISLTGTGGAPSPSPPPSAPGSDSQTVAAGQLATYSISASGFHRHHPLCVLRCANRRYLPGESGEPASGPASVSLTVCLPARCAAPLLERWRFTPPPIWLWFYTLPLRSLFSCSVGWREGSSHALRASPLPLVSCLRRVAEAAAGVEAARTAAAPVAQLHRLWSARTHTPTVTATAGAGNQHIPLTLVVQ
jgi:hypothetical protein